MISNSWSEHNNKLEKTFRFSEYSHIISFVNQVMEIANNQNHHPEISVHFNFVKILITDYEKGGVSEKCQLFVNAVDRILIV